MPGLAHHVRQSLRQDGPFGPRQAAADVQTRDRPEVPGSAAFTAGRALRPMLSALVAAQQPIPGAQQAFAGQARLGGAPDAVAGESQHANCQSNHPCSCQKRGQPQHGADVPPSLRRYPRIMSLPDNIRKYLGAQTHHFIRSTAAPGSAAVLFSGGRRGRWRTRSRRRRSRRVDRPGEVDDRA